MEYIITLKELDNIFYGVRVGTILPVLRINNEDVQLFLPNTDINILKCKINDIKPIEIGSKFTSDGEVLVYQGQHRFTDSYGKEVLISNVEVFD